MTFSSRLRQCAAAAALLLAAPLYAQLNENCTVSVLNRTTQARSDGSWVLPNVPANAGQVRARATCVENGVTRSGESGLFVIPANGVVDGVDISFDHSTGIPASLTLTPSLATLGAVGATSQLTATAVYADAHAAAVTAGASGTTYFTSNAAIATVDENGLVTAHGPGVALLSATYEGALGMTRVTISTTGDSDGDGMPDDWELANGFDPHNPADAQQDADGDGLTNLQEFQLGTNPHNADTDGDGISDGEEVVLGADGYVTNPLLADTDGDGINDGLEVRTGSDPTNRNSYNLARALSGITVAPSTFTLIVNTLVGQAYTQLAVTGTLLDGNTIDLTSTTRGTNYSSSDLTIINFGAPDGRIFAAGEGTATVTVTVGGFSATVSGIVRNFTPLPLSSIAIPGYANNVKVKDNYAFVAAGSGGLQVVNVANPLAPVIAGSRNTAGNANDVRIVNNLAYVANGNSGLAILDISTPAAPVIVGNVSTGGDASDVMVAGNVVYVANGSSGLAIVNAATPAAPILVGSLRTGGTARGVDVSGNYAIVADDSPSSAARIIDISTPTAPRLVGSISLNGNPKDVRVKGSIAYFATFTGGVQIVDFSTPSAPRLIGSLPGSSPAGFVPRDVELAGQFAIFAEQLFPNAVPFVDVTDPANPLFKGIINFYPLGDYAGTGIAVSGAYVYMTGESFIVQQENGTTGNTRLFIGQYLPLEDHAGNAPHIALTAPADGSTQIEGDTLTVSADATDDVAVALVNFTVDGQTAFTDTSTPYEYVMTVPAGVRQVTLGAKAIDLGDNVGTAPSVTVNVIPDPLTTVTGRVVAADGTPLAGATVTTNGGATSITGSDGTFSVAGVTTIRGSIIAFARTVDGQGTTLSGSSSAFTAVRGGTTDVGTITAVSAVWEPNYGTPWTSCDDCYSAFTIPFSFPYYGTHQTTAFVGSNGYITFGGGDSTYTETVPVFASLPRIAGFFDDLYGRSQGAVYVNTTLPGRFVVTYNNVQHYSALGSDTLQITLFADGRIQFGYRGITSTTTGTIVGITPGPGAQVQQVDFSQNRNFEVAPNTSIFEYFLSSNPFDLDYSFVVFTPLANGGYSVQTILQPPPSAQFQLTNGGTAASAMLPSATLSLRGTAQAAAAAQSPYAHAEVEVTCSRDRRFHRTVNTDKDGTFTLKNVPAGAINVTVRKKGVVVGVGSAVIGDTADPSRPVRVDLQPPSEQPKSEPQP
jgi:hypothetical protein